jgi:DNA helicase IV
VLSTLQPDQYTLVTLPAMESVVIEGQPGTGKTIVASHRAAYMINDDTPPENSLDKNVLLVGPTDAYSDHVRGVVETLSGVSDRVIVKSMPSLMTRVLELKVEPKGPASRTWRDVDEELGKIALKVILAERKRKGMTPTTQRAYEALRLGLAAPDVEWATYLRKLPVYDVALTLRAHIPLLAYIRWTVAPARELQGIEHVMVDEAQDVTALEWMLLAAVNEADAWTILGDLNQRRSDHTLASWRHVCEVIEYPHVEPRLERLERGYRSTLPILEFANRLLPKKERALLAFQEDGPAPVVTRTGREDLAAVVRSEVDRLLIAYPEGTVAVIDVDPSRIRSLLRREGWQAPRGDQRFWEKAGRQVVVMQPDEARGLEFDGVVVSEPAAFPENFGRRGPLYTSLTRPNRELAVVHSKPLRRSWPERCCPSGRHRLLSIRLPGMIHAWRPTC